MLGTGTQQDVDVRVMDVVAGGTLNTVVVDLDAVVKTVGAIHRAIVGVFGVESGVLHRYGMVVLQIGAQMFDLNAVGSNAVVAFSAVHQIITTVKAQMQRGVGSAVPAVRFKDGHINPHGAIVTGEAEQADGAGGANLVVECAAVVEVIRPGGGLEAVPAGNAAQLAAVSAIFFGRHVAVDTRRAVIGKGKAGHRRDPRPLVQAGKVVFGAEDGPRACCTADSKDRRCQQPAPIRIICQVI